MTRPRSRWTSPASTPPPPRSAPCHVETATHPPQAKACEAASTVQAAATERAAAEDAAHDAEQQLQDAAAQERSLHDHDQAAAEAARKLADARGEAAEKQKQRDVALHDASMLKAPVQHATKHAQEYVRGLMHIARVCFHEILRLAQEASKAKEEAQRLGQAAEAALQQAAAMQPAALARVAEAEKQLAAAEASAEELETRAEATMREAETQAGLARELFALASEYSAKYWQVGWCGVQGAMC